MTTSYQTIIRATKTNETNLRIQSEDLGSLQELSDYFTFDVPGAKYMPLYRSGVWDGKIRMFNMFTGELLCGLDRYVEHFCNERGYVYERGFEGFSKDEASLDEVEEFVTSLNLHSGGKPLTIHDYQLDALVHAINDGRRLLISPTASGKSLIIYCLLRWHLREKRQVMIMVPTIGLVTQMVNDFADYANGQWDVTQHVHQISGGVEKKTTKPCIVTTWQSMQKQPKAYFERFDSVICDEAHQYKAKVISSIIQKATNAWSRIGTTGTLDGMESNKLTIEGLLGPAYTVTTTKELMDAGKIAQLSIHLLNISYPEHERKLVAGADYQDEIEYLVQHQKRTNTIAKLASSLKKNTLVLFSRLEHGQKIHDRILAIAGDRPVYLVNGGTDKDSREQIRQLVDTQLDAIIVASVGVFSTGISIKNIHHIIFAAPTKSIIRVLQSIGRGLRLSSTKNHCTLYDIVDDFSHKKKKNHTFLHGIERVKIYSAQKFKFKYHQLEFK